MAKVQFKEDGHKYFDETGKLYTSTTTVTGKYKQPFDSDYWSTYKAIEKYIVEKKGILFFEETKKAIGGYERVLPYFLPKIINKEYLEHLKQDILLEWEEKSNKAKTEGTAEHKRREDETNGQLICKETGLKVITFNRDFHALENGVYTELVVWNEEYVVAGQADKVIIEDRFVDVDDYKTSNVIEYESFKHYINGHRMMKYPIDNIMDCNFYHYALQLSVYGYFIELKGFTIRRLRILHTKSNTWIEVPYLREEVIKMLNHFKSNKK